MVGQAVGVNLCGSLVEIGGDISANCMFAAWRLDGGCMAVAFRVRTAGLAAGRTLRDGGEGRFARGKRVFEAERGLGRVKFGKLV